MTTVGRSGGQRESVVLLWMLLFFGFTPVAAYFSVPGTRGWALAFGALLGLPLFVAALWRLGRCDALRLSKDLQTFELIQGSFFCRKGRRFPAAQVKAFHLEADVLRVTLSDGDVIRVGAEDDIQLRAVAMTLRIPFTESSARTISTSPADGSDANYD